MTRTTRSLLAAATVGLLAAGVLATAPLPAQAAVTGLKINEVESATGFGTPDWVEIINTTNAPIDISGFVVRDDGANNAATFPANTVLSSFAITSIDVPGLGDKDSARLFESANAAQPIDTQSWTAEAVNTWGVCAGQGSAVVQTVEPTRDAQNSCAAPITTATVWPGSPTVTPVGIVGQLTANTSGLSFEAGTGATPNTLWAVNNNPGRLEKLVKSGTTWGRAGGEWGAGKTLKFEGNVGNPDTEGITMTSGGSAAGIFAVTERDNGVATVSRPTILRYDPNQAGTTLTPVKTWDLSSQLRGLAPNSGPEGISFVPDAALVAKGLKQVNGAAYDPTSYGPHFGGVFFVAMEQGADVQGFALSEDTTGVYPVTGSGSGFTSLAEVAWEPQTQQLWGFCDDNCAGRSVRLDVTAPGAPGAGQLAPVGYQERPAGMPNLNNEGFTFTPASQCVAGAKPVFWTDDSAAGGVVLREGSISCVTPPSTTTPTTPGTTPPTTTPTPTPDTTKPVVKIAKVKKGKVYAGARPKPRCVVTDASGTARCTLTSKKKKLSGGRTKVVVTATATDASGNRATARTTYVLAKRR
jgi:hypothetical protein